MHKTQKNFYNSIQNRSRIKKNTSRKSVKLGRHTFATAFIFLSLSPYEER